MGFFGKAAEKKRKFDIWNENRKEKKFIRQGRELHRLRRQEEVLEMKSRVAGHKAKLSRAKAEQRHYAGMAFRSHFGGMGTSGFESSIFGSHRHTRRGRR